MKELLNVCVGADGGWVQRVIPY